MPAYRDAHKRDRDVILKGLRAIELRSAGCSWTEIADQIGYSSGASAYNLVKRLMDRLPREGVREMQLVQHERLLALLASVWDKATDPNHPEHLKALDRALDVIDSITKLWRCDRIEGPEAIEVSHSEIRIGAGHEGLSDRLRELAEARQAEGSRC